MNAIACTASPELSLFGERVCLCNDCRWARMKREYVVGARVNRFGCSIVRVAVREGYALGDDPAWFVGPAKHAGQGAFFMGMAGAVWYEVDLSDPSPYLDDATRAAWEEYSGRALRPKASAKRGRAA